MKKIVIILFGLLFAGTALAASTRVSVINGRLSIQNNFNELFTTPLFNDSNLASYYRMEGNSNDSKGAANGTDVSILYNNLYGKFGQGASYNGTSAYQTIGTGFAYPKNFSVTAWVYASTTSATMYYVTKDRFTGVGTDRSWAFGVNTSNQPIFDYFSTSSGFSLSGTNLTLPPNSWHFLANTYDGANIKIYMDGRLASTTPFSTNLFGNSTIVSIGDRGGSKVNDFWKGFIDDVAIWSRPLSQGEIESLYQTQLRTVVPGN